MDIFVAYAASIDISGSFALDAVPIFPIPTRLLPTACVRSPSTVLGPFAKYLITVCRDRLPDHVHLIDIISDICIENQHFLGEISRTKGTLWTETMYICHYINPLLHRLLSLPETDQSLPRFFVAEALRLGAIIYLAAIRYAFGISPFQSGEPARKIKVLFERLKKTAIEQANLNLWQDFGCSRLKIWVLGCAAINRPSGPNGYWFLDELHAEMAKFGMESYDDFEQYAGSFLWIPEVHGLLLRNLYIGKL